MPIFRLRSPGAPPLYRINLSSPPHSRYDKICRNFRTQIAELAKIYEELLSLTSFPRVLGILATWLLRRVHSDEETQELRGIAKASGMPLHLAVAYNTFLDLFSGCVSGGIRASDAGVKDGIVHFRGLDWEMEPLRKMMICVEYIREGEVVARGVTYAGYIGVLTGVRQGLSMSLNYRALMNSPHSLIRHRLHQLRLLLGYRPSMASNLRRILLSSGDAPSLDNLIDSVPKMPSSPCYLTFCSPSSVLIIQKDLHTAKIDTSEDFLVVTNHDREMENWTQERWDALLHKEGLTDIGGTQAILEDSVERRDCVVNLRLKDLVPSIKDVKKWLQVHPVRNETTHFSCMMDPSVQGGGLLWVEAYTEPMTDEEADSDE